MGELDVVGGAGQILSVGRVDPGQMKSRAHEMMVAIEFSLSRGNPLALGNKSVYICFILALVMLAASPMRAADIETPKTAQVQKTVVGVDPRTGKLVRSTIIAPKPGAVRPKAAPADISQLVEKTSKAHNVDPLLVDSVIRVESNYDPNAISPKGAQGLMQLMPPTAQMLGVNNSFDPAENIEAGVKYLKYLQDLYKDDRLALAAYNAGPAAVDKFRQIPPYPETQKYVEKVGKKYSDAKSAASQKEPSAAVMAQPASAVTDNLAAPEVTYNKVEQYVDADGRVHLRTTQ
jgi:hypothetical protein